MRIVGSKQRGRFAVVFNMTPMIDMVFLLIIFFVLVNRFVAVENVQVELPDPYKSQAAEVKLSNRVVINCLPVSPSSPADGTMYIIGPIRVSSLAALSERLAAAKAASPGLQVVLRADRRLPYSAVRGVMEVVARNQIALMNIVAHTGEGESG